MHVVKMNNPVKRFDYNHIRSNAFTYKNDPFHRILNDEESILTIKHLAIVPTSGGYFQLKSMLLLPHESMWVSIQHNYISLIEAKVVVQDLLNSVKKSATVSPSEVELAELDMEQKSNDSYGFSFLFSNDFKLSKV